MPKEYRLSHADFVKLQKIKPQRIHGTYFTMATYILPSPMRGPKVAFVVQKKIAPKAVTRNLIERRARSVVRLFGKKLTTQNAYIFHTKKGVVGMSFREIQKDITVLFERAASKGTIHTL